MAKGASGIGGGSGSGADTTPAFDSNNWRTWQKGTNVQIGEEDIGFADGVGRRGAMRLEDATVTDIYDDHIMVTTEDGTRHWIDDDTVDIVKSASNGNTGSLSPGNDLKNQIANNKSTMFLNDRGQRSYAHQVNSATNIDSKAIGSYQGFTNGYDVYSLRVSGFSGNDDYVAIKRTGRKRPF